MEGNNLITNVLYGKSEIEVEVPSDSTVIEPQNIEPVKNVEETIKHVLKHPTNSEPLKDMVKSTDTVSIVISDITRPTPNHILVPLLIDELNHVPLENFVIINGTGTHRDQTREELISMLGQDIVDTVKIVHNHCNEKESLRKVGESQYGCDVYLNKEYVDSDFKIVTGFIEPHFFAGFSGGPKGIMPVLPESKPYKHSIMHR